MRIAIVIERFHPGTGGNERSTEQIARGLIDRGHEVTLLTSSVPKESGRLLPDGGRVISREGALDTGSAVGLKQFVKWAESQIAEGGYEASVSVTGAVVATVVEPRGGTVRETLDRNIAMRPGGLGRFLKKAAVTLNPKQNALLMAEKRTFHHPSVKKIVAISRYVADQLFHHYMVSSKRVELIPNAAEVTPFDPLDRQITRRRMRSELRLGEDDVAFLFAARNPTLKGLPHLLHAMSHLVREKPHAKLLVAGVLDHGAMAPAEKLGLGDAVRWLGPTRQMDPLYVAADATVLPTWYDPSSKVVLESLLHGVPAISTLYNGASQWILSPSGRQPVPSPYNVRDPSHIASDPQPAGRVIASPDDIGGLARAMLELCDPDERDRCSAATIGIDRHISMTRHVERLERVLMDAVAPNADLRKGAQTTGG